MTSLASDRPGAGEPHLLFHGIGSTRDDASALLPRLAADFDVLSLDMPGDGEWPLGMWPPTVAALTDAVETAPIPDTHPRLAVPGAAQRRPCPQWEVTDAVLTLLQQTTERAHPRPTAPHSGPHTPTSRGSTRP